MTQHAWPPPDDQSAGEVLLAYWPALVRFARSITRDDALAQDLAARPEHRIVALSTVAGGDEFNGVIRVVAVIEYL